MRRPRNSTENGVLWLLKNHRQVWPSWPNGMGVTEPPICMSCSQVSLRLCPALKKGAAVIRASRFAVAGVHGAIYQGGRKLAAIGPATASFDDPLIKWVRATSLVRQLHDCAIISIPEPTAQYSHQFI